MKRSRGRPLPGAPDEERALLEPFPGGDQGRSYGDFNYLFLRYTALSPKGSPRDLSKRAEVAPQEAHPPPRRHLTGTIQTLNLKLRDDGAEAGVEETC